MPLQRARGEDSMDGCQKGKKGSGNGDYLRVLPVLLWRLMAAGSRAVRVLLPFYFMLPHPGYTENVAQGRESKNNEERLA